MQHESVKVFKDRHRDCELEQFLSDKFLGIAQFLKVFAEAVATNRFIPVSRGLSINILEAVKTDAEGNYEKNAQLGLALATRASVEAMVSDNKLVSNLGEDWTHAYMVWNFCFVYSHLSPLYLAKLVIPSITCAATRDNGEDWLGIRVISLALALMSTPRTLPSDWAVALPENFEYQDVVQANQIFSKTKKTDMK